MVSQKLFLFIVLLLALSSEAQAEVFPGFMNKAERRSVLPYFSNSYAQQVMTRPYFLGSKPGLEVGTSISYRNLSDLKDNFPTDNIKDELILTQLFIKKSLVHGLELTISSSLSSFGTTQASGFGGVLSWHPLNLEDFIVLPVISLFTNYLNFEDTLSFQESGLQLIAGKNFKQFSVKAGASYSKLSSTFSGSSNGRQITDSSLDEKDNIWIHTYFASVHVEIDHYLLTFTQNYTIDGGWNPNIIVSYQF